MGAEAVERGEQQGLVGRQPLGDESRARHPGQALVGNRHRGIAEPAVALQAQGRRAIGPGEGTAERGCAKDDRAETGGDEKRQAGPENGDGQTGSARQAARGNRAMGLVDRVHMAVEPVVDCLARAAEQGAGENEAKAHFQKKTHAIRFGGYGRDGGDRAAGKGPDRREPGHRLQHREDGGRLDARQGRGGGDRTAHASDARSELRQVSTKVDRSIWIYCKVGSESSCEPRRSPPMP